MKMQRLILFVLVLFACQPLMAAANAHGTAASVRVSEGTIDVPTYENTGRELEPTLFPNSSVIGLYPFPSYVASFKAGDPKPKTYAAIFVENEYVKLTYIPELGGRFFSLYDKIRNRQVFYRNDVIKPTMFNPRRSWPQSGIELTGPFDAHMLTIHGEPYWSHTIVNNADGSVSLVLGESDPVYHMKVNLTATLHPGVAALQISVFCYNRNDGQMPQMFWTNASLPATEKTHYIYPMTRTVGHTTGEVSNWPMYNGVDYSWDRNNKHMLGVFGIDAYDNFAGAYQVENDYGVFRYADRRVVQGMKMWTFGYGPGSDQVQDQYTDKAGPYIEVQSGRHVWDGHYEWIAPHKVERWSEWWVPVAGIGGMTTMTRDVALNLEVKADPKGSASEVKVSLSPVRPVKGAKLIVTAKVGEILSTSVDLIPGTTVVKSVAGIKASAEGLTGLTIHIVDAQGLDVMNYVRPDSDPGRQQYSPSAKELEKPQKSPEQMSIEELVQTAEFKLKEVNTTGMQELVALALKKDPGYSRAHLLLGVFDYTQGSFKEAESELSKATERDPYLDEGWYYLAMSQLAQGEDKSAERNIYYIAPGSGYFAQREYQLGRLSYLAGKYSEAESHLDKAVTANGYDLNAHALYAVTLRTEGKKQEAAQQLDELLRIDPTNRLAYAERYFLNGDKDAKQELVRLMGHQSQEAMDTSIFYSDTRRWLEASEVLRMVEKENKDPWGTSSLYYYTQAYYLKQAGDGVASTEYLQKAQAAKNIIDRFPARRESEAPLKFAIAQNAKDAVARFNLGCLLYFLQRTDEAMSEWKSAIEIDPKDFSARRELGLALADLGKTDDASIQLEKAIDLKPEHVRTLNDLSSIYARAGKFDEQISLLGKALKRSPGDDDLEGALLSAYLIKGRYEEADQIVNTHKFLPRHRYTILRDEYRNLRYGMGAIAFNKGDYAQALLLFQSALKPPVSLGVDDFQFESTPRVHYYIGRALEALGRKDEAAAAYKKSTDGVDILTGDRDSWNSENYFMILSLEKLGRADRAKELLPHFEGFAKTDMDETNPVHRGQARYLLGLIAKHRGEREKALQLMRDSIQALPDFLQPRYELRGDALDPLTHAATK